MGDLKPLGSEKLKGDEKIKRILELTYYNTNKKTTTKSTNAEYIAESTNCVYGIVREKDDYYVKKGLTESSLDYIGGMFMKNKNKFSSYGEALKRLDLLKGQESTLQEEKKYILKVNKSKAAAPAPAPVAPVEAPTDIPPMPDAGGEPNMPPNMGDLDDLAGDLPPDDEALSPDEDGEDEGDYLKTIQKLTGKLGEKLRTHEEEIVADDIKYVINSVVSALDLDKLEETDREEILAQFEDTDDEQGHGMSDELDNDGMPQPEMGGIPTDDSEIAEADGEEDALEKLVNTVFEFGDEEEEISELSGADLTPADLRYDPNVLDRIKGKESESEIESEICMNCRGTGVKQGNECDVCHGEGVIYADDEEFEDTEVDGEKIKEKDLDVYDVLGANDDDEDLGYDPIEMGEDGEAGEEYTGEEVFGGEDIADVVSQDIEFDELTDKINQSVKETLGKYFQ